MSGKPGHTHLVILCFASQNCHLAPCPVCGRICWRFPGDGGIWHREDVCGRHGRRCAWCLIIGLPQSHPWVPTCRNYHTQPLLMVVFSIVHSRLPWCKRGQKVDALLGTNFDLFPVWIFANSPQISSIQGSRFPSFSSGTIMQHAWCPIVEGKYMRLPPWSMIG